MPIKGLEDGWIIVCVSHDVCGASSSGLKSTMEKRRLVLGNTPSLNVTVCSCKVCGYLEFYENKS